jgi:hypothetical protein
VLGYRLALMLVFYVFLRKAPSRDGTRHGSTTTTMNPAPLLHRPTPQVPRNLERRAYTARSTSSGGPDRPGQPLEREGLEQHVCGLLLAGPPSPTTEEASSSGLGVPQTPGPNSGNPGKDGSRTSGESSRRNIPRQLLMAS